MKYLLIIYIALGLVLSCIISIEYNCLGDEMFPKFYGSPFVFVKTSIASSLEYYYGILGIILNTLIWSLVLLVINLFIRKLTKKVKDLKIIKWFRILIIGFLLLFSTLNILMSYELSRRGFDENLNYWHLNMEEDAKIWKMNCEGKIRLFLI
tara:strand:+ start:212 stop:667 length:456 start_codon:yes stop_codon:yes gene_type:complete